MLQRTGPYPLSVHLGMAASSWPVFSEAQGFDLAAEMGGGLEKMLQGVKLYHSHPYKRTLPKLPVVFESGTVSVGRAEASNPAGAILLVPSLINRSYILDLCEERSLARWLAAQGITAYLLDWGDAASDPKQEDLDALIMKRLVPAIARVAEIEGRPVAALGYCMGGTILTAAAIHAERHIDRLVMLASPWDFHAGSQSLLKRMKFWAPTARPYIEGGQALPVEGIQTLFASLDPAMAARKFSTFAEMDQGSPEARLFVATEDWLNEGVALAAGVAKDCIDGWFFENKPAQGAWQAGGVRIKPETLNKKLLIVSSRRDRLVEYESAAALKAHMPWAELLSPDCGHIGMIAGKDSIQKLWVPIAAWLKN